MSIKAILYILSVPCSLYALQSINFDKFLKPNKVVQARILVLILSLSISYLAVNFLYDFFVNTKVM
jgi:uncharacterized integral membrane protein (TIGR02327 family)